MHVKNARNIFLSIPKAEKKATLFTQIAQSALKTKKKNEYRSSSVHIRNLFPTNKKKLTRKTLTRNATVLEANIFLQERNFWIIFTACTQFLHKNGKCPQRCQSVFYQASNHRDFHNSRNLFYCVACQKRKTENELAQATKTCFKDDKSLRLHGFFLGHTEIEMFLLDLVDDALKVTETAAIQRKSPTRSCSNLNHC